MSSISSTKMASSAMRTLASRTLHLKVYPTPETFAERREVLRVIERFGEVAMFKSHKYDPKKPVHNSFLSVYTLESSAQDLRNVSPVRYRLVAESTEGTDDSDAETSKVFSLYASETNYNHNAFLVSPRQNPCHGPYGPLPKRSSYIAHTLKKTVPESNWSEGLVDWDTEKSAYRVEEVLSPEEQKSLRYDPDGTPISNVWSAKREEVVKQRSKTPRVMGGLQPLWEERVDMERRLKLEQKAAASDAGPNA
ncbi:hypothetical protein LZ554_000467 [Drepanopeziza brunnea f. sp. 'monogermtubi']|nr:hypothetical protein LZ554_000467 [Drepanopeziza brunnea f. sp. 'monogermtubi']